MPGDRREAVAEALGIDAVGSDLRFTTGSIGGSSLLIGEMTLAMQMRAVMREQLQAGRTPDDVKEYFVSKYGEWILLEPEPPLDMAARGSALADSLRSLGVDQFAVYLMHDQKDETLTAYGQRVIPALGGAPQEWLKNASGLVWTGPQQVMFAEIKKSLHDFGVDFDVYFHEKSLHDSGAVGRAIERLTEMGNTYEADGAQRLRTEKYGADTHRVIDRSNGTPAYISGDLGYYLDKRERGFDRCFIMLGADHHGYVGRMNAMCAAFGDEPGKNLEILIGQMVNLLRDGEPMRMSKRAGTVVTIDDLVDAIGVDASRYALARYHSDSPIDIDLDLWAKATNDNPVFTVQYAHARVASLMRNAADLGVEAQSHPELLGHEKEGELLRALAEFPRVVKAAAELREPHRVARYLEELAGTYHRFYDSCRVLPRGDEETSDLHRARLMLVDATRVVLANGLELLGVSAPERM